MVSSKQYVVRVKNMNDIELVLFCLELSKVSLNEPVGMVLIDLIG
jgi:hypothetical protein